MRLFDVLPNFLFTTSETMCVGNTRKLSKPQMTAQCKYSNYKMCSTIMMLTSIPKQRGARGSQGGPGGKLNGALIKETGKMCCELQEKKYEDNVLHRLNSRAPLDNYIAWDTCITCIIFNAG